MMTEYDEQLQAHLDAQSEDDHRRERLRHAYSMGLQCEFYCEVMRFKEDDRLIDGFIDLFMEHAEIDFFQDREGLEFESGCPTARRYAERMKEERNGV